ncbi:MAG: hypothetical protein M3167_00355 [Acidobacteriota bacterium]|nr:hypothetical protein [Acidobacteriota bacterium]
MRHTTSGRTRTAGILTLLAYLAATTAIAALTVQNAKLRHLIDRLTTAHQVSRPPVQQAGIRGGDQLGEHLRTLTGDPPPLGAGYVWVFDPECSFCGQEAEDLKAILPNLHAHGSRLSALATANQTRVRGFLAQHELDITWYVLAPTTPPARRAQLAIVPQLLEIDACGTVIGSTTTAALRDLPPPASMRTQ